ncbi:type IA DNA topoisomerase [Sphingobacterium siyangense]|uniref:type IA DNA topoisomerase n=1 Tax=Sphingobacterium siyangense TaxID=459529 RepID=UPI001963E10C|nr:type IA DNA topoisomerase [Sphingobacterium siyangense]QRY55892.1 topoisomerase C-terminal repeat-containing protein [Sphingobacterium siyangense]
MKAILAEKPSVASELARIVGATEKKDGYYEGGGFMVTWAYGHLVGLAMPEDYGVKGFVKESLPIIPEHFMLTGRKVRSSGGYVEDEGSKKQLQTISYVFDRCDSIIAATDAGREGEVIFRYIYEYLNCKKSFERLWISSLTEKAIIAGFDNLRRGSDFDGLFYAGRERSQADWLIGINATQALTVAMSDGLFSLGRVQTPTLALICKRYNENKSFDIKNYFQIQLEHAREGIIFKTLSVDKCEDKKKAEAIIRLLERSGNAVVKQVETKPSTIQAPLLFDLTGLQKEANKKLGYSAERTLELAQNLYEKKFITYPRTGSKYIPEDVWPEIPGLILALNSRKSCQGAVEKVKWERYNKHIVNSLKVTDHHGILITENIPTMLDGQENALYDMIAKRLLEAVSPACYREITDVTVSVSDYDFALKAVKITSGGWKMINGDFEQEGDDLIGDLPALQTGLQIKINSSQVLAKKTKPPALFTEADLLATMENVGNTIKDDEQKKALKGIGIGTPATRAAVIETLFERDYIRRDKKTLIPTEKGMLVYSIVSDKKIADAAMTAQWEIAFEKIENLELKDSVFHADIETITREITAELLNISRPSREGVDLSCPKCKDKAVIREKVVKCVNEECGWIIFRKVCGVQLSYKDIEDLLTKKRSPLIKKMIGKSNNSFDAFIVLGSDGSTSFEFPKTKKGKSR